MSGMDAALFGSPRAKGTHSLGRTAWAIAATCVLATGALGQSLEKRVSNALSQARLGNAHVGVSVLDISSGQRLADIKVGNGDGGFIPASNLKLLTSGAAFLALGKDFEFQTKIIVDGDRLVVIGAGDPGFGEPKLLDAMHLSVDAFVDRLVDSAKKAGVSGIREVVVDDRVFDRDYVHPDWPKEQLSRAYCAEVSGLNFHANLLNVYVTPGTTLNSEAGTRSEPSGSWITITRLARTVKEGNNAVWLEREPATTSGDAFRFKLHGTLRTALTEPIAVTVDQPGLFFGRAFADRASRAGLGAGKGITARLANPDETFAPDSDSQKVVAVVRTPLSVALERCNVDSENLYAESFCKLIGHKVTGQPGTWGSGTAVVRMQVKDRLGAEAAASLVLADGSGLSRNNRITPDVMTRWLKALSDDPNGQMFIQSLAVAGEEGTLRHRFKGTKLHNEVRAKSGYINGVRTLSGYVSNAATGKRVAFSVLCDNLPSGTDARAKEFHEQVVEAVDAWLYERCKQLPAAAPANTPISPSGIQQATPMKPTEKTKRIR